MIELKNEYFEAMGEPAPFTPFGLIDKYRFNLVASKLLSGSVLDAGAYFGDFLKKITSRDSDRKIYGTEVNEKRKEVANKNLGKEVVRVDFINGKFSTFANNSVDNVVCTEVIEHVSDHILAVRELCRVARKRIIITVPFNEKIQYQLCIYCCKWTPNAGHLHTFGYGDFDKLIPGGWKITKEFSFGNMAAQLIASRLPQNKIGEFLIEKFDWILSRLLPKRNRWLFVIIDKKG